MSAGQVDLTPLFMCSPLYGLSVCPVKGRGRPEAGAQRTLEGVGWTRWLGAWDDRDMVLTRLLHGHLLLYPFNSFFSSLKKCQSVPWAMIFCGLLLIIPTSWRRRA